MGPAHGAIMHTQRVQQTRSMMKENKKKHAVAGSHGKPVKQGSKVSPLRNGKTATFLRSPAKKYKSPTKTGSCHRVDTNKLISQILQFQKTSVSRHKFKKPSQHKEVPTLGRSSYKQEIQKHILAQSQRLTSPEHCACPNQSPDFLGNKLS